jgi:hypothetical protein
MVTHHPLDPLAANGLPLGTKLGMDARCAIRLAFLRGLSGRDRQA